MSLLYLVHFTNKDPTEWRELKCYGSATDQFPGVYCVLHTTTHKPVFPGKYKLILPLSLLLRQDYHINIEDHNGIQSEHNTLFPDQFNTFYTLFSTGKADHHEIVFHHPILIHPASSFPSREELRRPPRLGFVDNSFYTGTTSVLPSSLEWLQKIGVKSGFKHDSYHTKQEWIDVLHLLFR